MDLVPAASPRDEPFAGLATGIHQSKAQRAQRPSESAAFAQVSIVTPILSDNGEQQCKVGQDVDADRRSSSDLLPTRNDQPPHPELPPEPPEEVERAAKGGTSDTTTLASYREPATALSDTPSAPDTCTGKSHESKRKAILKRLGTTISRHGANDMRKNSSEDRVNLDTEATKRHEGSSERGRRATNLRDSHQEDLESESLHK
ncbi:hypothetical protein CC86DRAFT_368168 [Ophiobolus disseminans]|uniref:Uncharacterized protein n=1 Tax=Ophiobolus disseminans TaxID=1469910 RepID=A0A6A7A6Y0_9PLEO|nr:hypothetical protein CC86DRAFT_368168 [Ophiobolus disseminans]